MLWSSRLSAQLGCRDGRHYCRPPVFCHLLSQSRPRREEGVTQLLLLTPLSVRRDLGNLFERLSQSLNIPTELLMTPRSTWRVTASCRPANAWLIATSWPRSRCSLTSKVVMRRRRKRTWSRSRKGEGLRQQRQAARLSLRYFEQNELSTADDIHQLSIINYNCVSSVHVSMKCFV